MILETERLYLRRLAQADYPALCKILRDPAVMYAYEHAFDDAETPEWLDRQLRRYACYGFGLWAVILKQSGELIGQCGLTMRDYHGVQVIGIGSLFQRAYWHRGYATEAAAACRDDAFKRLWAAEVFSIIRDTNLASQRVAKRNAMTVRGRFIRHYDWMAMPHLVYSIKREEWSGSFK